MLDIKEIRRQPVEFEASLRSRGGELPGFADFIALEAEIRTIRIATEQGQARRNAIAKEIGQRKAKGEDPAELLAEMQELGPRIKDLESQLRPREEQLREILTILPNLPHAATPVGKDENDNQILRQWPEGIDPVSRMDFPPKAHWEIGESLGILDFEAGVRLAGARMTLLRGMGARLSRALGNFMLDLHTVEHGYTEMAPPFLTNRESLFGTGQLPKFEEDLFRFKEDPYYLIPTAEVPLTNLVRDRLLDEGELPIRMTAWTACFRREAGSAGKDTRGLIRQHQFDKVELVWITKPEASDAALETLTRHAEEVLRRLELPYRVVSLCTGDLGFAAAKTYDIEVWLPGQGRYREISSCSNTQAFQARRMNARFRRTGDRSIEPVHTLNGSGLAVGRTLVAILENFQQADGSVVIPEALRPHMGGVSIIRPGTP